MKTIVEKYYYCFNSKNFSGMLDLLHPEVIHEVNEGQAEHGIEAFRRFMSIMEEHYDESLHEIVLFENNDVERVAAEFVCKGSYLKSAPGLPIAKGQSYSLKVGAFFEFRESKILRITNYYNLQEWIRQVSEQ